MPSIPKRVADRIGKQVSVFQRVLTEAKDRDVNEADTVTIVKDMLQGVFGFDKYVEVTSEQAIRGTYVDLAVKTEETIRFLIEVKAIGLTLKENHLRQAVNYAANHGINWVVLTTGVCWELYRVRFEKPISHELVCSFNFLELSARRATDREALFLLCKEGVARDAIERFHEHVQSVNKYVVAALIQTDPVIAVIRRELKRVDTNVKVSKDEVLEIMTQVLKREVVQDDEAKKARRRVQRAATKQLRASSKRATQDGAAT